MYGVNKKTPEWFRNPISTREKLNNLIRKHAFNSGISHDSLWNELYDKFSRAYSINIKSADSPLDYAEEKGHLENLYEIADHIYS